MAGNFAAKAGYQPVPVTGFTSDVIANGSAFAGSTTSDVDGTGYYFFSKDFTAFGTIPNSNGLPINGTINSAVASTVGLSFQLADYSLSNSLRLPLTTSSGTLTFNTATSAGIVYVLATGGSGAPAVNITVTFTDNSTQVFSNQVVSDWYNSSNYAIYGIGRCNSTSYDASAGTTNPRLYQIALAINSSNFSKQIQSITFERTGIVTGIAHIMAISINTACAAPIAQATALSFVPAAGQISGSFAAASPAADQYLVVSYPAGATAVTPVDATTYSVGAALGTGKVIQSSATTNFSLIYLTPSTAYDVYVYAFNNTNCVGPVYNSSPLFGTETTLACSGPSNATITVGASQTYTTIGAALGSISTGISGPIVFELQSDYVSTSEVYPITVPYNACVTATNTIIVRPATGAIGLSILGANTTAIFDINGGNYFTIDGRPGGTGTAVDLKIINTNAAGVTVRIINEASYNTIKYCDVQGQCTGFTSSALSGVIYIATTTGSNGNDFNTISNNNIHATAGGFPAIGISAYGTTTTVATYNDNCTISNNNIYDFFLAGNTSTGVKTDVGTNAFSITGNSIYQTAARTYTTGATHRAFWITPNTGSISNTASGFIITDNYIGGTAANAGGTAYAITGANATLFMGMDLSPGLGTATSVQGNIIQNISLTSTSTSTSGVFTGIGTANGNINIGTVTGNTIGSTIGTGSITVTNAASGTSFGIRVGGGNAINISNNTVAGVNVNGNGAAVSACFTGIGTGAANGGATTVTITGNTIGSTSIANSINMVTTSTSTTGQILNGINISNGVTTSTISNNTIANLNNNHNGTGTTTTTRGIVVTTSASSITGNTIRNFSSTSLATGGGATSALVGIAMTSTNAAGCNVAGNAIYALSTTASSTTAATNITGLFYQGISTVQNLISRNFIHSFNVTAVNTNVTLTAIDFASATATVSNNMIRLGIKPDGTDLTTAMVVRGISSNSSSTNNSFLHNSIFIGGAGVGTTVKDCYGFRRTSTSGTYDIRNNIFYMARSNASTGGKMYAINFTTNTTGVTLNNNLYYAPGTGGYIGYTGAADQAAYTAGWVANDVNSVSADPQFLAATGTSATVDLHMNIYGSSPASNATTYVPASVTTDYDGNTRSTTTPDMGADEFDICTAGNWSGAVSSDWSNAANWCTGLPTALSNVVITSTATNMPVIGSGTQTVASITFNPGSSLTITAGSLNVTTLNITGNTTFGGAGKVNVTGTANLAAGTLTTGGTLVLKSTASGTARIPALVGSISGTVTTEAYIPGGRRAYRFLGHPFSSILNMGSLVDNIYITGAGAGFDATATNNPSSFWYDNTATSLGAWTAFTSTSDANWSRYRGIRILVRGDRAQTATLAGSAVSPNAVTLDATGTLNTGAANIALPTAGAYHLVSNPYPSPTDIGTVIDALTSAVIGTQYWVWDANASTKGAYITKTVGSGAYNLAMNGAFFVQPVSFATLFFTEANKTATATTTLFRNMSPKGMLEMQLLYNNYPADNLFISLNEKATKGSDANDGVKLSNSDMNFYAINADNKMLSLDARPLDKEDVIKLGLTTNVNTSYKIKVANYGFAADVEMYLKDKYTNTLTPVNANTEYGFSVNADAASQGENRFELVMKQIVALPIVTSFSIKLSPNPATDLVKVSFSNEEQASTTIAIVNAEGKTVKTVNAGNVQSATISINLKGLAKGNYFVTLNNGKQSKTEKLQVQ